MDHEAAPARSLFYFVKVGFICGAVLGIVLLATGLGAPDKMANSAQDGGALIGYPIGTGIVGAIVGLIFGALKKLIAK